MALIHILKKKSACGQPQASGQRNFFRAQTIANDLKRIKKIFKKCFHLFQICVQRYDEPKKKFLKRKKKFFFFIFFIRFKSFMQSFEQEKKFCYQQAEFRLWQVDFFLGGIKIFYVEKTSQLPFIDPTNILDQLTISQYFKRVSKIIF